ncbi:hypothetical protein GYA44_02510 [Candidatus Microgenomates bacterium]|jgi:hypothetical protein|nr:hypothetical protein [Candidatus Microgenomates bacterium]
MNKTKERKQQKEEKIEQLGLGIKEPFKNKFFNIKRKFDFFLLKFEVKKFLKDPLVWCVVVISIVMILTQLYLLKENYYDLPTYLPIFKTFVTLTSKLVSKEYILAYPVISASVLLLGMIVVSNYYNREKSLTKMILFAIFFTCIAQSIILIDLIRSF